MIGLYLKIHSTHDQKLINLLNMDAGDQKYINEYKKGRTGHPLAD